MNIRSVVAHLCTKGGFRFTGGVRFDSIHLTGVFLPVKLERRRQKKVFFGGGGWGTRFSPRSGRPARGTAARTTHVRDALRTLKCFLKRATAIR